MITADVSASGLIYTFSSGNGILVELGIPTGDGFTYTTDADSITISDGIEEYLVDTEYSVAISGTEMTWSVSGTTMYVFEEQ